jgi:hypothetical protein
VRSSGGFAGAYYSSTQANGKSQAEVDYSYQYNCDPLGDSVWCTGGGSPRWSIPINTDQHGKVEGYAFIPLGVVEPREPPARQVRRAPSRSRANRDALAVANPTYRIGHAVPFVITDTTEPGTTLIFAINVTK